jgi:methionine-S-sulfoxide reductase
VANKNYKKAYLASGCFWGTEYWLRKTKGVISTSVGYCGGDTENPSYEDICTGKTGHAETTLVVYDTELTNYESILKKFFETHDPSQENRQGPDIGTQYRSAIFYQNNEEKEIALSVIQILKDKGINVVTELNSFEKFWEAEDYHQNYYFKKGQIPYCHVFKKKF